MSEDDIRSFQTASSDKRGKDEPSGSQSIRRRLAAILAADVAGYTRLIEEDTAATVAAWQTARDGIFDPEVAEHEGRIVKLTGDGFLAEFPTVQAAVECAITMQERLGASPLEFRMGVSIGDIVDDGRDIYGEGINIAARLESIAEPGGILISGDVYNQVRNRIDEIFLDLGHQQVKHVSNPVSVYAIQRFSTEAVKRSLPSDTSPLATAIDKGTGRADLKYTWAGAVIILLVVGVWLFGPVSKKADQPTSDLASNGETTTVNKIVKGSGDLLSTETAESAAPDQ